MQPFVFVLAKQRFLNQLNYNVVYGIKYFMSL